MEYPEPRTGEPRGRVLVVSHACVLPVNQCVYARLHELGWDVTLVVPKRWRHEYRRGLFDSIGVPELKDSLLRLPVLLRGRPQRHIYLCRLRRLIRRLQPDVILLEEESFSLAAAQWARAAHRARVPFGVQAAENLDRSLPRIARALRRSTLRRSALVTARSPAAADLARLWGARGRVKLIPHAVPGWDVIPTVHRESFTVGFAGRLVPEKGVHDLVEATGRLDGPVRALLVGDGVLRSELEASSLPNGRLEILSNIGHDDMPGAYAEMDVLVLPSRTTRTWAEQFGRVLVEALWCGVPIVGSDSGEIPWVIETTGGGRVFPEGDVSALTRILAELQAQPEEAAALAERGRQSVRKSFAVGPVTDELDRALLSLVAKPHANSRHRDVPTLGRRSG